MSAGAGTVAQLRVKEIARIFEDAGATSPETAKTLVDLGLDAGSPLGVFLSSVGRATVIHLMMLHGHIRAVGDRYYLDVEKFDERPVKALKDFIVNLIDELHE